MYTAEEDIREAICIAVERPGEWVSFERWKALATEETITVEHGPGEGDLVAKAVGVMSAYIKTEVLERTATTLTVRRRTFDETVQIITRILTESGVQG